MATRRTLFFFFLGILSTCCADEFYIITPATLRLDSYETIAIAFDGQSAVEATVNIQDHPGRIKSIAQIKLDIEPGRPEIFKVELSPSEFPPQYFSVPTVPKKVVINVSSRTFRKSVVVPLNMQSGYVFIQTDKPIYTPQQRVRIRIVPLGEDALPSETRFKLQIKNPRNIIVEEIPKKSNPVGGFVTHIYKFPLFPDLGEWSATVLYGYEFQQNSTVHFDLQEYVLPTFTVELVTQDVILPSTEEIRGTVTAKYVYGKKVEGIVTFRLGVKGEAPEATFFTIIGPKTLVDGSYTFRLQTDNLKETQIGWFPEIEGARFIVEATVVDFASGNSEVAVNSNGRFSMSPFVISFKRCLKDFRPGLVSVVEADILYVDGKPAAGISTKIKASADGKPLTLITDSDVSDEEGKVSFNIQPEMFHSVINITLETADPRSVGSQAIGHFRQQKFESGNQAYIAIDRSTRYKIKPGDKLTKFVHFEPEKFSDTYYLIISKGKILQMDKLPKGAYKVQTVEFEITYDMVPTFRLVVFAQYKDELIADSLKLDVENKCHPEAEVRITPEFKTAEPGQVGKISIHGSKQTSVGLSGVDEAVYALSKKGLLTKSEIFSRFASHDIGCGPGGGLNVDLVLGNAGILIATKAYSPSEESINSCVEVRRRKREIAADILNSYDGLAKQCCALGMNHDIHNRTCEDRSNIVVKYLSGEHQNCSRAFLECCLHAQERKFTEMKLMDPVIPLNRMGEDPPEPFFLSIEEEEQYEKHLTVRRDFRETWFFEDIRIGPDKEEQYVVSLPHSITTWVIQALSVSPEYGICITEPQKIISFQKVFLQLNLPYSVVRNEQVEIQATVFNFGDASLYAIVYMYGVKDLCSGAHEAEKSERKRITVDAHSSETVAFPVIPLKEGVFDIKVVALSPVGSDVIQKKLNVVPEGHTKEVNIRIKLDPSDQQRRRRRHTESDMYIDSIDPSQNLQITAIKLNLPEDFVPGTESCSITAIGDLCGPAVSTSINNPEQLINEPTGCGEQTMVLLAPTLYIMRYLKVTGKMTPESEEKGYSFIRQGYDNELHFQKTDGSYAAFQDRPSSVWLTAFVTKVFCQASELVYIDETVICGGTKWLIDQQQPDGSFIESYSVINEDMMGGVKGAIPLTAFTLITLEECRCLRENSYFAKKRAMAFLETNLVSVDKPLAAAIVSYALSLSNSELKEPANDLLFSMSTYNEDMNTLFWETGNSAQDVEIAGYALLNLLLSNDLTRSSSIVNWLNSMQQQSGCFKSTQDTVVALQALSEYAMRIQRSSVNLVTNISSSNDRNLYEVFTLNENNALVLQELKIRKVGGLLFLRTNGHGVGALDVKLRYNVFHSSDTCKFDVKVDVTEEGENDLDLESRFYSGRFPNRTQDPLEGMEVVLAKSVQVNSEDSAQSQEMKLKISICMSYLGNSPAGMSIADVGVFSGFETEEKSLKQLKEDPNHLIEKYEISAGGVIFYLQSVPIEQNYCFDFLVTRKYIVGNIQTSVVKVYDYYNPDESCTVFYRLNNNSPLIRTICDGGICQCAEGGCPPKDPFSEVSQLPKDEKRERLKEIACEKYDFVWKGKVEREITKDNGFYNIHFTVEEVIKEGIERKDLLEQESRLLLVRDNCNSALMIENAAYVILGKDGEKYKNLKGEIWHRYLLDKNTVIYKWASVKEARDRNLQLDLNYVMSNLQKQGCDL